MTNRTTLTTDNAAQKIAGLQVRKSSEMRANGSFIVIYGQGGAGKTSLVAEVRKLGNTLLADTTKGADAISHLTDIDCVELTKWADFDNLTKEVKKAEHGYVNIIIENVTELAEMDIARISGPVDQPEIQEWGQMTRDVLAKTREWRDIASAQGINVFFLAWDASERDERNVLKLELAFTPRLREAFPGVVTIIGHITVLNDPDKRLLTFAPGPKTVSKFRRAADAASRKVPYDIYYGLDNLPMADILRTMKGEQDWPDKKYPKPAVHR